MDSSRLFCAEHAYSKCKEKRRSLGQMEEDQDLYTEAPCSLPNDNAKTFFKRF